MTVFTRILCLAAWLWPALLPTIARAQVPPTTHPASEAHSYRQEFDLSARATGIDLWPGRYVLGYDPSNPAARYAELHFTCRSQSDSANGRCMTQGSPQPNVPRTDIPVRFTERRSGRHMDLHVGGHLSRAMAHRACGPWLTQPQGLHSTHAGTCAGRQIDGTGVTMDLPAAELERLPPGAWTAKLLLDLRNSDSSPVLATYTFDFHINVTDVNGAAIFLPKHPVGRPHIGLNLKRSDHAVPTTISGVANVDMCLYDGRGSVSRHLELRMRDDGSAPGGRPAGMFSVWRTGGAGAEEDRVDYEVLLQYSGAHRRIANGAIERLEKTDEAEIRPVRLPGMPDFVYCVPTPMTLNTPAVLSASKRPGYYLGQLVVEMTVPTTAP